MRTHPFGVLTLYILNYPSTYLSACLSAPTLLVFIPSSEAKELSTAYTQGPHAHVVDYSPCGSTHAVVLQALEEPIKEPLKETPILTLRPQNYISPKPPVTYWGFELNSGCLGSGFIWISLWFRNVQGSVVWYSIYNPERSTPTCVGGAPYMVAGAICTAPCMMAAMAATGTNHVLTPARWF